MRPREPVEPRGGGGADLVLAALVSAAFLGLLWVVGPVNVEQYHHSHPSVRVFHQGLLDGRLLLWSTSFGLGTPIPLGENLALHPLVTLEPLISLAWVFRSFWWFHLTLGGWGILRLCRTLKVDRSVGAVAAFCYTASPVTANYTYTDDWPSVFVGWSTLPIVLLLVLRVEGAERRWQRPAAALALVLGFLAFNSHLGYLVVWIVPVTVFALAASGRILRTVVRLSGVGLVAHVIASERLFALWSELRLFPAGLEKWTHAPFVGKDWILQLVRPLSASLLAAVRTDPDAAGRAWLETVAEVRLPYLGLAFSGAAVWATVVAVRGVGDEGARRRARALAAAFWISVGLSVTPPELALRLPSAMWLGRDPALVFGLLLAGVGLSGGRVWRGRGWVAAALATQVLQAILVVVPPVASVWRHRERSVDFYRGARAPELADWIVSATGGDSARIGVSPGIGRVLMMERTTFAELGLLAIGDLEPLGLRPLHGYFKNVSMDAVYPSYKVFGGRIAPEPDLFGAATILDVLSVEYLLTGSRDRDLDTSGLERAVPDLPLAAGGRLRLFRNPGAWPPANLFDPEVLSLGAGSRAICERPGLLCRDLSFLEETRLGDEVVLSLGQDRLVAGFSPSAAPRILVTSFLHRPEWRARTGAGAPVETFAVAGALLAVEVSPGVETIRFEHRPAVRRALLALGGCAALGLLVVACSRRR